MRLYKVCDGLYIGGTPRDLGEVSGNGIGAVVALHGPDRSAEAAEHGLGYWHLPLPDGRVRPGLLQERVELVTKLARDGGVLVHCRAGRNRSALVAALAYAQLTGCTGAMALAHVRAVRPRAVANPHFEAYLTKFVGPSPSGFGTLCR
jgi:protein-tyrosine phosphatase